jgi:hypothetical protein
MNDHLSVLYSIANDLIRSMNESADPCEDFYNFACGTWIKNTRLHGDCKKNLIFDESKKTFFQIFSPVFFYELSDRLIPDILGRIEFRKLSTSK